jgi:uncharacterized protein YjbI with pentapeptide repeats
MVGTYRGDLVKDLIIGVVVGVLLLFGAMWWDAKLVDRQDGLARDLAHQAEVLENTRFVRQLATSNTKAPKPFANINLEGAQLGGLELACIGAGLNRGGCADFDGANLQKANLTGTTLYRADLSRADLRGAILDRADFRGASLDSTNLSGVVSTPDPDDSGTTFRAAQLDRTALVGARLAGADFRRALLFEANGDKAVLSSADFRNASMNGARFEGADLRKANFRGVQMYKVDLTSADLRGTDFTRADLRKAVLTDVCFDHTTKWGSNAPPTSSSC